MARYFILICFFCPCAWAQLAWEKRDLDFHAAPSDTNVVARFVFENAGQYPVVLRSVQSTCGCTAVAQDKKRYEPGEKGEIIANFGFGQRVGLQKRNIIVQTDDRAESKVTLSFRVRIPQLLKITPAFVYWLTGDPPEPKTIQLQVGPDAPLRIRGVHSNSTALPAQLRAVKEGVEYVISVTPADTGKPAIAVLRIETDFPMEKPRVFLADAMCKKR